MDWLDNGIRTVENGRAAFDVDGEQQGKQQGDEQSVRELDFFHSPHDEHSREYRRNHSQRNDSRHVVKGEVAARKHSGDGGKRGDEHSRAHRRVVGQHSEFPRGQKQRFGDCHKRGGERDVQGGGIAEKQGDFPSRSKARAYHGAYVQKTYFRRAPHIKNIFICAG